MLKQSLSDNPIITSRFRVFGVLDRVVESLSGECPYGQGHAFSQEIETNGYLMRYVV